MTSLSSIVAERSLVVVGGAGGVGKTTMSAAIGLAAARHGEGDVLVLTIDPARRLATTLGLEIEGGGPVEIPTDGGRGRLFTAMLDPGQAWNDLVIAEAPDEETADRLLSNAVFRRIADTFVHGNGYAALNWLAEAIESEQYRLIIVDTPPSQSALDFFDAPGRVAEFFGSPLLGWLTNTDPASMFGTAAAKTFASIADRLLGAGFFADVLEFFQLMHGVVPALITRAGDVSARVAGDEAGYVAVTGPGEEMVERMLAFRTDLSARSIDVDVTVVNGVEPDVYWDERVRDAAERVLVGERSPFTKGRTRLLSPGADYVLERTEVADAQSAALAVLDAGSLVTVPRFVHSPVGLDAIGDLADRLWSSA
ncbi:MAG: ArsA family ATPase [Acidimicrobiales bacterium]